MMNNIGKVATAKRDPNTTTATIYAVENAVQHHHKWSDMLGRIMQ